MKRRLRSRMADRTTKMLLKLFVLSYCAAVFGTISVIKGNNNKPQY